MRFILLILFCASALAGDAEVSELVRAVKLRRAELQGFREKVSLGRRCELGDYGCFKNEVRLLLKGHPEEAIEARRILDPFYLRSIKNEIVPCSKHCRNLLLKSHLTLFINYMNFHYSLRVNELQKPRHPTLSLVRAQTVIELSAHHYTKEHVRYIEEKLKEVEFEAVDKGPGEFEEWLWSSFRKLKDFTPYRRSVLCLLSPGGPVYDEIMLGANKSKADQNLKEWMQEFFDTSYPNCEDKSPIVYRGLDQATRKYYRKQTEGKLAAIKCSNGDFGCIRKALREIGITYSEDVEKIAEKLKTFEDKSRPATCDKTCEAQLLVRMIQTWITYLSTFERDKLASTMDWKKFPQARYQTITEDVELYQSLRRIFSPLITSYGKIDPRDVKEEGLKSELRSIGKDLSDFASAKMLKDSILCEMEPWTAAYDRYLSPYKDKKKDKKFEEALISFKSNVCK